MINWLNWAEHEKYKGEKNLMSLLKTEIKTSLKLPHPNNCYSKSDKSKAFVHVNCVFVNESGLTLECCIWLVLLDTSLQSESVTLYSKL
jgi:hypothetical protein